MTLFFVLLMLPHFNESDFIALAAIYFKLGFFYLCHVSNVLLSPIKSRYDVIVLPLSKLVTKPIVTSASTKLRFILAYIKFKLKRPTAFVSNRFPIQIQVQQIYFSRFNSRLGSANFIFTDLVPVHG